MKSNSQCEPKMIKTLILLVGMAVAPTGLTACGQGTIPSIETEAHTNTLQVDAAFTAEEIAAANFQFIKDKVFTPHCLKCHASDVQRGDVNLEDYSSAFQLRDAIRAEVEADRMPRRAPPLSPELKELLFSWIDNGAPEL